MIVFQEKPLPGDVVSYDAETGAVLFFDWPEFRIKRAEKSIPGMPGAARIVICDYAERKGMATREVVMVGQENLLCFRFLALAP